MIRISVTISLVAEARGGPFVFQGELDQSLSEAASLGYDGVELFLPSAVTVDPPQLRRKLRDNGLTLSALGTGGGFLTNGWTLCSPEKPIREAALRFILEMMCLGGEFQAPVIIGSMRGSIDSKENRDQVLTRLIEDLAYLDDRAQALGTTILLEPLNRYETNLVNRLEEGVTVLDTIAGGRFRLLADLFHMNIEEESMSKALGQTGSYVSYLHFVDSNRRPAGFGHIDFEKVALVLREIRFDGFLSAETFPYPTPRRAAEKTLETYNRYIQPIHREKNV